MFHKATMTKDKQELISKSSSTDPQMASRVWPELPTERNSAIICSYIDLFSFIISHFQSSFLILEDHFLNKLLSAGTVLG